MTTKRGSVTVSSEALVSLLGIEGDFDHHIQYDPLRDAIMHAEQKDIEQIYQKQSYRAMQKPCKRDIFRRKIYELTGMTCDKRFNNGAALR